MEVIVAKTAGFCFGVKKAVEIVYEQIGAADGPVYTFGPVIHNEEVVADLEAKGVRVLESEEELSGLRGGTVIIRSHGVGPRIYRILEESGAAVVDATCPFVKKIHEAVVEQSRAGRRIVIAGDRGHPEVEGIMGWCGPGAVALENPGDIEKIRIPRDEKLFLVAQTTFNYNKFQDLVEKFLEKGYDILVLNTICHATQERQVEAKRIASQVDAMIVIGGRHSSNTQKLYEICKKECSNTYYIQTLGDLNPECVSSVRSVGITAGASTPNHIIEEVHTHVRVKF